MKATLITGASGGIGEAIAYGLAQRKHNLLLIARNSEKLEKLCIQLHRQFGVEARYIATDLSKAGNAEGIFEEVQKRGLEIEMLINNAGIGSGGEFSELSLPSELNMIQLNIISLVALTHLFLTQMKQRKSGTIVNIASMVSFAPFPYMATYGASKAFVRSFTEAITQECKPHQVHVLLFCPGLTKTNFNSAAGIDNEKAVGLSSDYKNAPAQTPQQVAKEVLKALDRRKHFAISGKLNRIAAKLIAILPNSLITGSFAKMYRRKLGQ